MVEFVPLTLNIPANDRQHVEGDVILRGKLERGAQLEVRGNLKLGKFSDVGEGATVTANAPGNIVLSEQFTAPHGLKLAGEDIKISDIQVPESNVMAADLSITGHRIHAYGLFIRPKHQMIHFRADNPENSSIELGVADGHSATVRGFEHIDAMHLIDFSRSPKKDCGINCRTLKVDFVKDSLVCAQQATIAGVSGKVEFMPQGGEYDYGTKRPGYVPFLSTPPRAVDIAKTLDDDREFTRFHAEVMSEITGILDVIDAHPRDLARYSESVKQIVKVLREVKGLDFEQTPAEEVDRVMTEYVRLPAINIKQMLYRRAERPGDIAYPVRTNVILSRVGEEGKPAKVQAYYGNVTVKENIADHSTIATESGQITLGTKEHPVVIGKNVTLRANEIHLPVLPDPNVMKTLCLEGQVYVDGKRREDLDQLRQPMQR